LDDSWRNNRSKCFKPTWHPWHRGELDSITTFGRNVDRRSMIRRINELRQPRPNGMLLKTENTGGFWALNSSQEMTQCKAAMAVVAGNALDPHPHMAASWRIGELEWESHAEAQSSQREDKDLSASPRLRVSFDSHPRNCRITSAAF
jgi:hypothetical protein